MMPVNDVSRVRHHLEKFIANAVFDEGAGHLERACEIIEGLQADQDDRFTHVISNMLRTYIQRFLSTCEEICRTKTSESAYIQNLLRCAESLEESGCLLAHGIMDSVLNMVRELRACIPNNKPELSISAIVRNFLSLSAEEQESALRLLKRIGIATGRFEKAREKHLQRQGQIIDAELSGGEPIYIYEIPKHGAEARMVIRNGSHILLRGSTASGQVNASMAEGQRHRREELIRSGKLVRKGSLYAFTCDVSFNSPSEASGVVSGSSTNGWLCFKIPR